MRVGESRRGKHRQQDGMELMMKRTQGWLRKSCLRLELRPSPKHRSKVRMFLHMWFTHILGPREGQVRSRAEPLRSSAGWCVMETPSSMPRAGVPFLPGSSAQWVRNLSDAATAPRYGISGEGRTATPRRIQQLCARQHCGWVPRETVRASWRSAHSASHVVLPCRHHTCTWHREFLAQQVL